MNERLQINNYSYFVFLQNHSVSFSECYLNSLIGKKKKETRIHPQLVNCAAFVSVHQENHQNKMKKTDFRIKKKTLQLESLKKVFHKLDHSQCWITFQNFQSEWYFFYNWEFWIWYSNKSRKSCSNWCCYSITEWVLLCLPFTFVLPVWSLIWKYDNSKHFTNKNWQSYIRF